MKLQDYFFATMVLFYIFMHNVFETSTFYLKSQKNSYIATKNCSLLLFIDFCSHYNFIFQKKDGSEGTSKTKPRTSTGGLPPPPGNVKIAPPPARTPTLSPAHKPSQPNQGGTGEWGDYSSATQQNSANSPAPASTTTNASWVQF